jgi:prolyl oligopeptidase
MLKKRAFKEVILFFIPAISAGIFMSVIASCSLSNPPATKIQPVADTLHGVEIVDNYRWLENGDDPAVLKWEDQQDKYCRDRLSRFPGRERLQSRIEELMKIGYIDSPVLSGGRYFYKKRDGDAEHAVLLMKRAHDSDPEVIIDPNLFSADGTTALDWWHPSSDGKFIAYGKSSQGTENSTLFIYDIDRAKTLEDSIPYARAASVAWLGDNSGFYYTRYPDPGTVPDDEVQYHRKVYLHKIGDDYHADALIFGEGRDKTEWPGVQLSPDDRYLLISAYMGWSKAELYLKDLQKGGDFIRLTDDTEAIYSVQMAGDGFYVMTNDGAPKKKILKGNYRRPKMSNWKLLIPEGEDAVEHMSVVGERIVLATLHNASSRISVYSSKGQFIKDIELPAIGSLISYVDHVIGGEPDGSELAFGYYSYFIPPRIYLYDFKSEKLSVLDKIKTDLDLSLYKVEQIWYPSKDGTEISMFLIHRKDIKLDGSNPTMVNGYGGFSGNETPHFSRTRTMFLKRGGVFAHTQLRGGGEYGEEWHRAGMLENKQNVFDDFIAACEWLIDNKYTNPEKLLIEGGSNGGLLVGAALVQRPDLIKAVVCWRPLLDMLRYHKFLIGELWIPEYGSSDDPEQFKYLYDYSPYHHIKPGVEYPAVLFQSADHDTRVDPLHSRKMTAALQAATSSDNPIMLRLQRKTGHGRGVPKSIVIEELIDEWCFVFRQLGMQF